MVARYRGATCEATAGVSRPLALVYDVPMIRILIFVAIASLSACKKKEEPAAAKKDEPAGKAASKSGLAWEPDGYDKMTPTCRKVLACCEELVKAEKPGATAEDYNLKCSGPALWKEPECEADLKSRVSVLESESKPVPPACK
jgi:hypothetical protein